MPQDELHLTLQPDSDGTGQLFARVAGEFAGVGSAWFDLRGLEIFARSLEAFPLPADAPPTLEGGFWRRDGGGLEQAHLRLVFEPANRRGIVGVRIELATPVWPGDRPAGRRSLGLELYCGYAALQRFAQAFAALARGECEEAVLEGGERP